MNNIYNRDHTNGGKRRRIERIENTQTGERNEQYIQQRPHKRDKETNNRKNRELTNRRKERTIYTTETTQTGERDEE